MNDKDNQIKLISKWIPDLAHHPSRHLAGKRQPTTRQQLCSQKEGWWWWWWRWLTMPQLARDTRAAPQCYSSEFAGPPPLYSSRIREFRRPLKITTQSSLSSLASPPPLFFYIIYTYIYRLSPRLFIPSSLDIRRQRNRLLLPLQISGSFLGISVKLALFSE